MCKKNIELVIVVATLKRQPRHWFSIEFISKEIFDH